eukprot:GDKJ01003541.1.p1 GENE.GDKJ01003541.1~~GDKJ01003541.1.p1  ORF type:complete len:649 (-),score=128.60 GDKJ01003541.1:291-2237(-)
MTHDPQVKKIHIDDESESEHENRLNEVVEGLESLVAQKEIDDVVLRREIYTKERIPFFLRLKNLIWSSKFAELIIGMLIITNAIFIGLIADSPDNRTIFWIEKIFNPIFTVEIVWKMMKVSPKKYVKDFWNWFDIFVVIVGWVDIIIEFWFSEQSSSSSLKVVRVFRILRIFRVFRILRVNRELQLLVEGMYSSIRPLLGVLLLIAITLFCGAVFAKKIFSSQFQNSDFLFEKFGTVPDAMFTLLQVITLEGWATSIARPIEVDVSGYLWFFVLIIIIGTYGLFNILTAVFVEHSVTQAKDEDMRRNEENKRKSMVEVSILRLVLRDFHMYPPRFLFGETSPDLQFMKLHQRLVQKVFVPSHPKERADDEINKNEEWKHLLANPEEQKMVLLEKTFFTERCRDEPVRNSFENLGITTEIAHEIYDILDAAKVGVVNLEEFINGCIAARQSPSSLDLMKIEYAQRRRHCSFVAISHHQQIAVDECRRRMQAMTRSLSKLIEENKSLKARLREYDQDRCEFHVHSPTPIQQTFPSSFHHSPLSIRHNQMPPSFAPSYSPSSRLSPFSSRNVLSPALNVQHEVAADAQLRDKERITECFADIFHPIIADDNSSFDFSVPLSMKKGDSSATVTEVDQKRDPSEFSTLLEEGK